MLETSGVEILLFERNVLKTDFAAALTDLEPQIGAAGSAEVHSAKFPFLRHVAMVGKKAEGESIESWDEFLIHGQSQPRELVEASAAAVQPSDVAVLFFSSGSTSKPKGILSAHRGVSIQMWRFRRMYGFSPELNIRCWTANGYFWSGNFAMALGNTLASGGSLVLQPTFDPGEALELIEKERVNFPFAWPHQWAQLVGAPNWDKADLSSLRYVDFNTPVARHPTVTDEWHEPGHAYGNTETFTISTCYPANTPPDVAAGSSGKPLPGVTIRIVDALTGEVVPRGERGEICVKGPTLMLGYIGTPLSETVDDHGFFHTGDGGYVDDTGAPLLGGPAHRHHQDRRRERVSPRGRRSTRRVPRGQGGAHGRCPPRHARGGRRLLHSGARRSRPRCRRGSWIPTRTACQLQGSAGGSVLRQRRDQPHRHREDQVERHQGARHQASPEIADRHQSERSCTRRQCVQDLSLLAFGFRRRAGTAVRGTPGAEQVSRTASG